MLDSAESLCADGESLAHYPSHRIGVQQFEINLLWPVHLQPLRDDNGAMRDTNLDPRNPDFSMPGLVGSKRLMVASGAM